MPTPTKFRALHEDTIEALLKYFHSKAPEVDLYNKVKEALHVQSADAPGTVQEQTPAPAAPTTGTTSAN